MPGMFSPAPKAKMEKENGVTYLGFCQVETKQYRR
jgi:hypothetical protein